MNGCPSTCHSRRTAWVLLPLSMVLLGVSAWPLLRSLCLLLTGDSEYSHGLVVALVSLYALRESCRSGGIAPGLPRGHAAGPPVVAAGGVLMLAAYWYAEGLSPGGTGWLFFGSIGLLVTLAGVALAVGGTALLKQAAFPLAFLVFAIPLPGSFLAATTLPLRLVGSVATTGLLKLSGIAVVREGNVLYTSGGPVGIVDACSGLRSLWVLLAAAVAMLHFGRFSWRRGTLLVLLAAVLALAGNLIRLYVTALFIAGGHHGFAAGHAHELLGLVVFLLPLAGLITSGHLLALAEPEPTLVVPVGISRQPRVPLVPLLLLLALTTAGATARVTVTRHYAQEGEVKFLAGIERKSFAELPAELGDFSLMRTSQFQADELAELLPTDHLIGYYMNRRGQTVEAQFSYWNPQSLTSKEAFRHPHWPDTCYPSQGWSPQPDSAVEQSFSWLPGENPRVQTFRRKGEGGDEEALVVLAWRSRADPRRLFVPAAWQRRFGALLDSWHRKHRQVPAQYGVTLRVFLGRSVSTPADALAVIDEFGQAVGPLLPAFGLRREADQGE